MKQKKVGDVNPRTSMDRISELPDVIIHHILSFLPSNDAARTRVLSKKWSATFASFPILDFDQRYFDRQREQPCVSSGNGNMDMIGKNFKKFIDNSLQSWPKDTRIQKFRLYGTSWNSEWDESISRWIEDVSLCNVKELDIECKYCVCHFTAFTSSLIFSVKSIIGLRLSGCCFENCNINIPLMRKLYLGNLQINQVIFENLISSCPLIEDLRLVYCRGLKTLQLSNLLKLNTVELKHCCDLIIVDITAPNFQSFLFYGKKSQPCAIKLTGCRTLKQLTLYGYNMTSEWLQSPIFSFPALEELSLRRCNINIPLMRKLYLGNLQIDQVNFENLISSCPLIEDLRLVYCRGLKTLQLSNLLKLNTVELKHCRDLIIVDITAPNFQSFLFYGKKSQPCAIKLAGCRTLKKLTLYGYNMTSEWLQSQISSFPALEALTLRRCNQLENITISGEKLKSLCLRRCWKLEATILDAPNLTSFEYKGIEMPSFAMDPSCLREVKLSFGQMDKAKEISGHRCVQLKHFLSRLNHGAGLKLVVASNKDVVIHEDLHEMSFPPFGTLMVEIVRSSKTFEDLVDHVLQTYHPDSLSVMKSSLEKILKFMSTVMSGDHNPSCCNFNTNKCWRHGLVDYQIVHHEEDSKVNKNRETGWFEWIKEHVPGGHLVLKWNK